mmetsp:Transcript_2064/g.3878  ORF Transcript_2064/g.3878 Transcript_2064/m.3878 type:complete len:245 (-) Transcript_2064:653-1387(-)
MGLAVQTLQPARRRGAVARRKDGRRYGCRSLGVGEVWMRLAVETLQVLVGCGGGGGREDGGEEGPDGVAPLDELGLDLAPLGRREVALDALVYCDEALDLVHLGRDELGGEGEYEPRLDLGLVDLERLGDLGVRELLVGRRQRRQRQDADLPEGVLVRHLEGCEVRRVLLPERVELGQRLHSKDLQQLVLPTVRRVVGELTDNLEIEQIAHLVEIGQPDCFHCGPCCVCLDRPKRIWINVLEPA